MLPTPDQTPERGTRADPFKIDLSDEDDIQVSKLKPATAGRSPRDHRIELESFKLSKPKSGSQKPTPAPIPKKSSRLNKIEISHFDIDEITRLLKVSPFVSPESSDDEEDDFDVDVEIDSDSDYETRQHLRKTSKPINLRASANPLTNGAADKFQIRVIFGRSDDGTAVYYEHTDEAADSAFFLVRQGTGFVPYVDGKKVALSYSDFVIVKEDVASIQFNLESALVCITRPNWVYPELLIGFSEKEEMLGFMDGWSLGGAEFENSNLKLPAEWLA